MKVMEKRDRVHVPEVLPAVKKAKFIKALQGFTGDARLYELDEPIEYRDGTTKFVAVSQTHAMFSGPETYIFASDADVLHGVQDVIHLVTRNFNDRELIGNLDVANVATRDAAFVRNRSDQVLGTDASFATESDIQLGGRA